MATTPKQRCANKIALIQEVVQLKHAENPEQSQNANNGSHLRAGNKQAQIGRQDGQQVNHAIEASNVGAGPEGAVNAKEVFNGKEHREDPFQTFEDRKVLLI